MRAWLFLMGGLIVWTVHFFALYAIASVLPGAPLARALVLAATVPAFAAGAWLIARTRAALAAAPDDSGRWPLGLALLVTALGLVGVGYQALPALIG